MTVEIKGKNLVITMPIVSPATPSASGKSLVVATSSGNRPTTVVVEGKLLTVGVNAYIKA